MILFVATFVAYAAILLSAYLSRKRDHQQPMDELELQLRERMDSCQVQIELLEQEALDIRTDIDQLERKINPPTGLSELTLKDTNNLIAAFRKELRLRDSKLSFFRTAARRLSTLLRNHRLQGEIAAKRERLHEMREKNYDNLAEMEEIRYQLEREQTYINTIEELGRRVEDSNEPADAERLVKELEEMTRQVNRS
jgi:hypothetical protein